MIKNADRVSLNGLVEIVIKVNIKMMKEMGMAK